MLPLAFDRQASQRRVPPACQPRPSVVQKDKRFPRPTSHAKWSARELGICRRSERARWSRIGSNRPACREEWHHQCGNHYQRPCAASSTHISPCFRARVRQGHHGDLLNRYVASALGRKTLRRLASLRILRHHILYFTSEQALDTTAFCVMQPPIFIKFRDGLVPITFAHVAPFFPASIDRLIRIRQFA